MKRFVWPVTIALVAILAFVTIRSCSRPDLAAFVPIAEHQAAIHEAEIQHGADQLIIKVEKEIIAEQEVKIKALVAEAGKPTPEELAKDREIAALEKKVAALEGQGDLAGALAAAKTEISAWAEKFNLADRTHQESVTALNKAWQVKFDAQVVISAKWKAAYDREHALRLSCEDLSADLAKAGPAGSFERAAHDVEGLGVGVYSAVRYKDPLPLAVYAGEKVVVKILKLVHK